MLTIDVRGEENYDESISQFVEGKLECRLELEHSLISLSKWESEFEKPFLGVGEKSDQEVRAYVMCMILNPEFPPEVISRLTQKDFDSITEYIDKKSTATWFASDPHGKKTGEVVTSELIYYWMISHNIPFECQQWHLNRLFTLIRVCSIKNSNAKPRKQTKAEMLAHRAELNAARRAQLGTSG